MKTGTAGIELIKSIEKLRLAAYMPTPNDRPTIGYGCTTGVKMGDTCTPEQAEQYLRNDLETAEFAVTDLVSVPLNQNEFDALVSFAFNLGHGNLQSSTLLKLLNMGDRRGAAMQFNKWCFQKGIKLNGLVKRRAAERELFERSV